MLGHPISRRRPPRTHNPRPTAPCPPPHPLPTTPELITLCEQLTDTLAIALLTHQPLEAPLKGFPPDQPNLLSAIQTWLAEL
ncbi:hypothetical protein [Spirulina major]|uniref:NACHT C-terminal alpha/beta 1 domain-containing protein n=1 Tax=Spirulina major TaxID=270636 RepID=UPI003CCBF8C6